MRVVLVGLEAARRRLRAQLFDDMEVVGEAVTLEAARAAGFEADGWLLIPDDPAEMDIGDQLAVEPLTAREREVLELVGDGLSNRAIAGRLAISDQTVKYHVASICGKLGAANRTDAVRRALRVGLLTL